MSSGTGSGGIWPADVIHVNEDGWVLINRGQQHGVPVGLRLLVVGAGARELRDLFANEAASHETEPDEGESGEESGEEGEQAREAEAPVVLRTRRTYELLEVVHVEPACAVAIAARTPTERRPQFYRGTQGELLVWAPLPATFTYPQPNENGEDEGEDDEEQNQQDGQSYDRDEESELAGAAPVDAPPQRTEQEDERWEEALPLNGVGVGDQVVPAMPIGPAQPTMTAAAPAGANTATNSAPTSSAPGAKTRQGNAGTTNPFEEGKDYDWLKPRS